MVAGLGALVVVVVEVGVVVVGVDEEAVVAVGLGPVAAGIVVDVVDDVGPPIEDD